jgi:hypothetical protein
MAKRAPARKPFVMTVAALTVGAAGCGGRFEIATFNPPATDSDTSDTATSETEGDADPGACPRSAPSVGTTCSGDLSCNYTRCAPPTWQGDIRVQCIGGVWKSVGESSCNPPPPDMPCPATEPSPGSYCYRPTGGACTYPDKCSPSGTKAYSCEGGSWKLSSPTTTSACPATRPVHGSSCGGCAAHCTYGDCYGTPTIDALCDATTGTWQVVETSCNPPPPPLDGGGA